MAEVNSGAPSHHFTSPDGTSIPMYLVSFDKEGNCISPRTREHLLAAAASGRFSDVHIYSHGWNNVFQEALAHYTEFFSEYFQLPAMAAMHDAGYRPMIVGIIWPSTALLSESERTPGLASFSDAPHAVAGELCADMTKDDAVRFGQLTGREGSLSPAESLELSRLLAPVLGKLARDDESGMPHAAPEQLLRSWGSRAQPGPGHVRGGPGIVDDHPDHTVESAGLLSFLNPKEVLRKATVYLMKDRAGTVGSHGVHALLQDVQASKGIRIHLTGHSYGAKVVLAALSRLADGASVTSVLLLQPAVNAFCFAAEIAHLDGRPGGYRSVLDKSRTPIYTTFSRMDKALNIFFPLALRRLRDQGEMAAQTDLFAALGAGGPQGMGAETRQVAMLAQPAEYGAAKAGVRICALDGSDRAINSHGDVRNPYTEWALANLVRQGMTS
jgi:pimeloyl-ACP methyl ester carboxylesterase